MQLSAPAREPLARAFRWLLRRLQELAGDPAHGLAERFLSERIRWPLWIPVILGAGIGIYFALPSEPPPVLVPLFGLAAPAMFLLAVRARRQERAAAMCAAVVLGLLMTGWALAQFRTLQVAGPVLAFPGSFELTGRVLRVEPRGKRQRLLLGELSMDRLPRDKVPLRVRVSIRATDAALAPGDRVSLRARLQPPPGPSWPGGFDFARRAYFEQIGAIGFALGSVRRQAEARRPGLAARIASLRQHVAERVLARLPGDTGAVAAALLTGLRGSVPEEVWEAMQLSGLAHLLAISGLHMGLVAGTVFLVARFLFAAWPAFALRLLPRKAAALVALPAAFFYLLLAGAPVPTQRAFVMVAVALLAILLERNPFSMRLVAVAALVVLALQPEALLSVSFQMSFAAVIGLVAWFERESPVEETVRAADGSSGSPVLRYLRMVLITTLIASLCTLPFAAFHFQRAASYGVIANLFAVPLTAFWIMPAGLLALLAMPMGGEAPFLAAMGGGIELLLAIARSVAALPGASIRLAAWPDLSLLLVAFGGLWLALWTDSWRRWGAVPIAVGVVLGLMARPPDVLLAPWLRQMAVRLPSGEVRIDEAERDSYVRRAWLRAMLADAGAPFPGAGETREGLGCDPYGCLYRRHSVRLALSRSAAAFREDCRRSDLLFTSIPGLVCRKGARVWDGRALTRAGGMAIWFEDGGLRIETVREARGDRPWSRGR